MEPHLSGHHASYLRWIVEGARTAGIRVHVITSDPAGDHPGLAALWRDPSVTLEIRSLSRKTVKQQGGLGRLRQFTYWRYFHAASADLDPTSDAVLMPYADYAIYAIGFLGTPFRNVPWAAICMRPNFHQHDAGIEGATTGPGALVQSWLYHRVARGATLGSLLVIDESFLRSSAVKPHLLAKTAHLPDPAEVHEPAGSVDIATAFGFDPADTVILVYGAISARKNLGLLLEILASKESPPRLKALIAGVHEPSARIAIEEALARHPDLKQRIVSADHYFDQAGESLCFRRADIVWVVYQNHLGMSGVLVQAARYGKPVVAVDQGLIAWHVRTKGIGIVLSKAGSSEENAKEIQRFAGDVAMRAAMGERARTAFASHSVNRFKEVLFGSLLNMLADETSNRTAEAA